MVKEDLLFVYRRTLSWILYLDFCTLLSFCISRVEISTGLSQIIIPPSPFIFISRCWATRKKWIAFVPEIIVYQAGDAESLCGDFSFFKAIKFRTSTHLQCSSLIFEHRLHLAGYRCCCSPGFCDAYFFELLY